MTSTMPSGEFWLGRTYPVPWWREVVAFVVRKLMVTAKVVPTKPLISCRLENNEAKVKVGQSWTKIQTN